MKTVGATDHGIDVKVILDSINSEGIRLTTMQLRYPRMIHSEFMTHRQFSRNGRSSRAVPVVTLMEEAKNPYLPIFLLNQKGMSAGEELDPESLEKANKIWLDLAEHTRLEVLKLQELKVHKQWANRPLETFGYIDVLVSSTYWANWFALRDHEAAQPEIQRLAKCMKLVMDISKPNLLEPGEWHLPYIEPRDWEEISHYVHTKYPNLEIAGAVVEDIAKKISTARCARLTYKPFDGNGDIESEIKRHDLLVVSQPVHASPAEHQATPDEVHIVDWCEPEEKFYLHDYEFGNFYGWRQYRKTLEHECVWDEVFI